MSLLIQVFADECKSEYEGSQSPGLGGGQQRGHLNEEITFREPLISQEMPVAPDTKKAKIQISNCIQGFPVPSGFCARAGIACLCHLMLNPRAAPSLPAAVEALCSHPFLPRKVSVAPGLILMPQGDPLRGPLCKPHFEGRPAGVLMATGGVKWAGPAGVLGAIVTALTLMDAHSSKIP